MATSSEGEAGARGGVSDSIVTEFSTYEDFLDSQITPTDLYYLEVWILVDDSKWSPPIACHFCRTKSSLVSWWSLATEAVERYWKEKSLSCVSRLQLQANKRGETKKGNI